MSGVRMPELGEPRSGAATTPRSPSAISCPRSPECRFDANVHERYLTAGTAESVFFYVAGGMTDTTTTTTSVEATIW
jgi:hypothetical protein